MKRHEWTSLTARLARMDNNLTDLREAFGSDPEAGSLLRSIAAEIDRARTYSATKARG